MKVLFMGGGIWGTPILEALVSAGHEMKVVIKINNSTRDGNTALKNIITKSLFRIPLCNLIYRIFRRNSLYQTIWKYNISTIFTKSVNDTRFISWVKSENFDLIMVASWDEILVSSLFQLPKYEAINCHPSLLPRYRGTNPFYWVILHGEKKSGVTFHQISVTPDGGAILAQAEVELDANETGESLAFKTGRLAARLVRELLESLEAGRIVPVHQSENEASYFPLPGPDEAILWHTGADEITRKMRAGYPWVSLYSFIDGKKIYLEGGELWIGVSGEEAYPGQLFSVSEIQLVIGTKTTPVAFSHYLLKDCSRRATYRYLKAKMRSSEVFFCSK